MSYEAVQYHIDVVGTRFSEAFANEDEWVKHLRAVWEAIGNASLRNILDEINAASWKNPTGRLQRAVAWEAEDYAMIVYMDPSVAPHAIYQEFGVQAHVMRYLLNATGPIPVPTGETYLTDPKGKYPRTVFRKATERWMGVPHPYTDQRGVMRMASGWQHPGYEGKRYFRKGIERTLEEAQDHLKTVVLRMREENIE
jgi:hypothetical protein